MELRLDRLPVGGGGVVTKIKNAPRLQAVGLIPGAQVCCKYKSRGVAVLAIEKRRIALRLRMLRRVWVDY